MTMALTMALTMLAMTLMALTAFAVLLTMLLAMIATLTVTIAMLLTALATMRATSTCLTWVLELSGIINRIQCTSCMSERLHFLWQHRTANGTQWSTTHIGIQSHTTMLSLMVFKVVDSLSTRHARGPTIGKTVLKWGTI
jgi:hypothetical protein